MGFFRGKREKSWWMNSEVEESYLIHEKCHERQLTIVVVQPTTVNYSWEYRTILKYGWGNSCILGGASELSWKLKEKCSAQYLEITSQSIPCKI